jgi:hypothetical protein
MSENNFKWLLMIGMKYQDKCITGYYLIKVHQLRS